MSKVKKILKLKLFLKSAEEWKIIKKTKDRDTGMMYYISGIRLWYSLFKVTVSQSVE